jgi:N-acetylneuraminate synthase
LDAVFACGWNCVKFQKRNPDICIPEHQKNVERNTPWGKMTYLEYKHKIELGQLEYDQIDEYSKSKPLDWTASVWDMDSLNFLLNYDVPFIKIPSALITNLELLDESAKSKIPIIVSTGMSNWEMIDSAVNILEKRNAKYALLHCNSTYPAPHNELNLAVIPRMIEKYKCVVGYSGHEYDLEPSVVAAALGARIIERHITLDHDMWGTDQKASLEVHAMDLLRKRIEDVIFMLGGDEKIITESEKKVMQKLRL